MMTGQTIAPMSADVFIAEDGVSVKIMNVTEEQVFFLKMDVGEDLSFVKVERVLGMGFTVEFSTLAEKKESDLLNCLRAKDASKAAKKLYAYLNSLGVEKTNVTLTIT